MNNTGRRAWDAVLPFRGEGDIGNGVTTGNPAQMLSNTQNLALIQVPGVLIALDGLTGQPKWQWPIPAKNTLSYISGWDNHVGLLLQGEPIVSPYFPTVTRPTVLASLDAEDGSLLWLQNATSILPLSQAEAATYAVEAIAATNNGLLYSRANKLLLIDWADGSEIWKTFVSLEGSVGTGQGANITHLQYIPKHMYSDKPQRILVNANNWGFQRFVMLALNGTNATGMYVYWYMLERKTSEELTCVSSYVAPPTVEWRSRFPETSLKDIDMTAPAVDNSPDSEMFYYWSNRTIWNYNEDPRSDRYLVGRKMSDGKEVWSTKMEPLGLPSTYYGRVFVTSPDGLHAIQGNSGSTLWKISGDPSVKYSYGSSPTFDNGTGIMVAVRCMQSDIPTLCMYSAFDPAGSGATMVYVSLIYIVMNLLYYCMV